MDTDRYRVIAGTALLTAATMTILGFTTAEAMYPGYSTTTQTISALGAEGAPPASQSLFNPMMVVAGLLTLVATYGLHQIYRSWPLTGVAVVTAVGGFIGVGLFPAQFGFPHLIAAIVAFGGMGVIALIVAVVVNGPFRYASAILGGVEFVAFVAFFVLGGSTALGVGGLERWVAYLGLAWAVSFGGYLLSQAGETDGSAS